MNKALKTIFKPKKVELSDVAAPKPSKAASRVLDGAVKRAYEDQESTSRKAQAIRAN